MLNKEIQLQQQLNRQNSLQNLFVAGGATVSCNHNSIVITNCWHII